MARASPPQPASPEYLIIAPNTSWVQDFADWKTRKGVPTLVANVTWISTNITSGRDLAEKIWIYIHNIYTSTSPPTLRWVLLIGDNSTIPPRYVYLPDTTEWTGLSSISKPTDFYYSVMDDPDWDDDNDGYWGECSTFNVSGVTVPDEIGDWFPDLYVGRIPFSDETNVTSILSRAIRYERDPKSYSSTGWETFLLAGAISNYDEEYGGWGDGDYTDEAELNDRIADDLIPSYYSLYPFYERRLYFWDYTTTHSFQYLNSTAVADGIHSYSPALINLAGHGSPTDIQRKYDTYRPYGGDFQLPGAGNVNVTGVAIGDPDNDGYNEIAVTLGAKNVTTDMGRGLVLLYDGLDFTNKMQVWDLWNNPPPPLNPCWATCVDVGFVWNNATIAIVVGTNDGAVIIFTYWNNIKWTAVVINWEPGDPVLCIEVGNADNVYQPGSIGYWVNVDIAWGHRSGNVLEATCFGAVGSGHTIFVSWVWKTPKGAVYSIDVGNPNDDSWGEITIGTGYPTGGGNFSGDCYMLQCNPNTGAWSSFTIDTNVGAIVYGLDTGDAGNDGYNKVAIGLSNGAVYMYESGCVALGSSGFSGPGGTDNGTRQTVASPGSNHGLVRCLRIGYVDENPTTPLDHRVSIIVGAKWHVVVKYHATNTSGFVDSYIIDLGNFLVPMTTAIDVGELSYTTGETEPNMEVATGGDSPLCYVYWYEWKWNLWDNMINASQALVANSSIPALIYADSCLTGAFDYPQMSLASAFLLNSAIGYIGSMRISWYYMGPMSVSLTWGLNRYMDYAFWQLFFSGSTGYRPGWTLYQSKTNYFNTFNSSFSRPTWNTYHRKNLLSYALFGDPEVDVYTRNPGTLTVIYPSAYPRNFDVAIRVLNGSSPVQGATICLWDQSGSYYQVGTTNSTGYAVLNLATSPSTILSVTVTKHNFSPHEGTLRVAELITVSGLTLSYDTANLLLNITGVTAHCPNHGYLTETTATIHDYSIIQGSTVVFTGQLSWDSSTNTWQAINVACNGLAEGSYRVRCYFEDVDGVGWADSAHFTVEHHITITTPTISFDQATLLLNITGVIATCSYTAHNTLNDTEALTHTYTIYDADTNTATAITGNLTWTGTEWRILNLNVSSLDPGSYYVVCTFSDSDVPDTDSPSSPTFTIPPPTPPPTLNPLEWLLTLLPIIILAIVVIIVVIIAAIVLLRRRKPPRAASSTPPRPG